jgi:hypothetical protein
MKKNRLPTARRRTVHLSTIDDLAAEVERLAAAAASGRVQSLGHWSTAQALWHVGRMIEFSFDGFPFRYLRGLKWLTLVLRAIAWRWLIRMALRPGFTNPPYAVALEPDPAVTLEAAAELIRRQIARIQKGEQMTQACSIEGPYTHEQWIYIHLRHAELHFSFLEVSDVRA